MATVTHSATVMGRAGVRAGRHHDGQLSERGQRCHERLTHVRDPPMVHVLSGVSADLVDQRGEGGRGGDQCRRRAPPAGGRSARRAGPPVRPTRASMSARGGPCRRVRSAIRSTSRSRADCCEASASTRSAVRPTSTRTSLRSSSARSSFVVGGGHVEPVSRLGVAVPREVMDGTGGGHAATGPVQRKPMARVVSGPTAPSG